MLIDSHCHLDDRKYRKDFDSVLDRAHQSGVKSIISIGAGNGLQSNKDALAIASSPGKVDIYATIGIHPHNASSLDEDGWAEINKLSTQPR